MLTGIGFLAVITASVTAALIESSRRRFAESEGELARRLQEVSERLVAIEALLVMAGFREPQSPVRGYAYALIAVFAALSWPEVRAP